MDSAGLAYLVNFYADIDVFLLIAVRILGFVITVPVLSANVIPRIAKIMLSVTIAYIIFVTGKIGSIYYYDNLFGYLTLVVQELIIGLTMGFAVYIAFSVLYFAGQMIDYQIGYSMLNVLDPITQIQAPIVGNLLYFVFCVLMIQSGGLNAFISAVFYSYEVLPVGSAEFLGNEGIVQVFIQIIANFFVIGVRIASPIVGAILVIDVALGLLVKAAPQMNVFVVGMPLKLFVGLIMLYTIVPSLSSVYEYLFDEANWSIINIVRSLVSG